MHPGSDCLVLGIDTSSPLPPNGALVQGSEQTFGCVKLLPGGTEGTWSG